MMHDQEPRTLSARVVEAVDRFPWDEDERAWPGGVVFVTETQHELALEEVEAASDAFTVTPVPADPTAMNRPPPGGTTTAFITLLLVPAPSEAPPQAVKNGDPLLRFARAASSCPAPRGGHLLWPIENLLHSQRLRP